DDAGVAAGPAGIALRQNGQQLFGEDAVAEPGDRLTPGMEPAAFAERDQPLDDRAQIFRLRQGRADLLMLQERGGEVLEHRLAMRRGAAEAAAGFSVTHRKFSSAARMSPKDVGARPSRSKTWAGHGVKGLIRLVDALG